MVAPQVFAVSVEMVEDEINGFACVLSWTACRAMLLDRRCESIEGPADIAEFGNLLRSRRGCVALGWG